jgi:hypothetical protein
VRSPWCGRSGFESPKPNFHNKQGRALATRQHTKPNSSNSAGPIAAKSSSHAVRRTTRSTALASVKPAARRANKFSPPPQAGGWARGNVVLAGQDSKVRTHRLCTAAGPGGGRPVAAGAAASARRGRRAPPHPRASGLGPVHPPPPGPCRNPLPAHQQNEGRGASFLLLPNTPLTCAPEQRDPATGAGAKLATGNQGREQVLGNRAAIAAPIP